VHPEREVPVLAMAKKKTKSLDDYRRERYETVTEFITFLGIGNHTYYAAMAGLVRPTTMRRIAEKLGVHPSEISEFLPRERPEDQH
jgi:DNA-directed RNA polymerase specialized sigma54-like protein